MHPFTKILTVLILIMGISACDQSSDVYVVDDTPEAPDLQDFYLVDSDGFPSDHTPNYESVLDPEVDNGIFEVYWSADSFDDYWVTISINDRASMAGSIVLSQDLCGYDLACDYDGMQVCEYTLDAYMGCGIDLNEADRNLISIDPLLEFLPEYLYLNIEVCHTSGFPCEVSSREVTVY